MAEGDTFVNALIGGTVSIVLGFVPLSPVIGGAIAGYLEGGTRNDGLWVGVYAGLVAALPALLGIFAVFLFSGVAFVDAGPRSGGGIALFLVIVVLGVVATAIYTVGLSAAGGWLGNYVKYDTDLFD
jgi:hypothetical protein